jgi:hypothetical protein
MVCGGVGRWSKRTRSPNHSVTIFDAVVPSIERTDEASSHCPTDQLKRGHVDLHGANPIRVPTCVVELAVRSAKHTLAIRGGVGLRKGLRDEERLAERERDGEAACTCRGGGGGLVVIPIVALTQTMSEFIMPWCGIFGPEKPSAMKLVLFRWSAEMQKSNTASWMLHSSLNCNVKCAANDGGQSLSV